MESAQNLVGFLQGSGGKVIGPWHGVRHESAGDCEEPARNLAEVCFGVFEDYDENLVGSWSNLVGIWKESAKNWVGITLAGMNLAGISNE